MNVELTHVIAHTNHMVDRLQYQRTLGTRIRAAERSESTEVGNLVKELAGLSLVFDLGYSPEQSKIILSAALLDFADFIENTRLKITHSPANQQHTYAYDVVDKLVKRRHDVLNREISEQLIPKILGGKHIVPAKDVLFTLAAAKLMDFSLSPDQATKILFQRIQDLGRQVSPRKE